MSRQQLYKQRIQRKIIPGDTRFNVNNLSFTISNRKIFFHNAYCYLQKYDFILLNNEEIKIGLQHQYLSKNIMDLVIAAGSITIDFHGHIVRLDNQSGTFQFSHEEQQKYLENIHSIASLQHAVIYNVDYQVKQNLDEPIFTEAPNRFYQPLPKKDIPPLEFENFNKKEVTRMEFEHILKDNEFDYRLYQKLNTDLKDFPEIEEILTGHFIRYGQYERGRGVGYYK